MNLISPLFPLIYRRQLSILYSRVDYTETNQGMLHKLFKNGDIALHTTTGSGVELTISDIPDYTDFVTHIKTGYSK